jgi:hypothetical protein
MSFVTLADGYRMNVAASPFPRQAVVLWKLDIELGYSR